MENIGIQTLEEKNNRECYEKASHEVTFHVELGLEVD